MSHKNYDKHNRFRSITVGFRVSPEEAKALNQAVALSGLSKQEYCYRRCMGRDIVVQGSPRVYKALKEEMIEAAAELKRLNCLSDLTDEWIEHFCMMTDILDGMKEAPPWMNKKK